MEYPASVLTIFHRRIEALRSQYSESVCWPWSETAVRNDDYGQIGTTAGGRRKFYVHRMSHDVFIGPIPPGAEVLHACDYKPCCNPRCLRAGSHRDNLDEQVERMVFARGERQGHAKLTGGAVRAIRARYARGEQQKTLAEEFGVSNRTICDAVARRTWAHI